MNLLSFLRRSIGLLALVCAMSISADAFGATEDVIHMADGRVLHGQIVSETNQSIVFDYMNQDLGITVTMNLPKAAILKIDRDVEVVQPSSEPEPEQDAAPKDESEGEEGESQTTRSRTDEPDDGASTFYIIEMGGNLGTDIRSFIYEDVIEEIKAEKPDVVIFKLDSAMLGDSMLDYWTGGSYDGDTYKEDPYKQQESVMTLLDETQKIVQDFLYGLPEGTRQVLWVHDATGAAALLALSWPEMYMTPDADLGSLGEIWSNTQGFPDADVRSKMELAWLSTAKGIMVDGGHTEAFVECMLRPNEAMSFSCIGRQPVWYQSYEGDLPIGLTGIGFGECINRRRTERVDYGWEFCSSLCEDLLISDGTAETLEDLALLLDERSYRVLESEALQEVAEYKDEWRGRWDRCLQGFKDYVKYLERAGAGYALENLNKAKKALSRVIGSVRSNESVAIRFRSMTGLDQNALEGMMKRLEAQIRNLVRGGGGGGRGGAGGGRGGAGGGPRP